ncbi:MAG: hypothetical protein AAGI01_11420 [Myxococcota bacterium]
MSKAIARSSDWEHLFKSATAQCGLFTTQRAAEAGCSPQQPVHHLGSGDRELMVSADRLDGRDPESWAWSGGGE